MLSACSPPHFADQPLMWAPPSLDHPRRLTIREGSRHVRLSPHRDYVIALPRNGLRGGLWLQGGHNVRLVGGSITIGPTANQRDNGRDNTDTGIYVDGATGTVHLEGILLQSAPNVMFDGIDINAPEATVQIENVRILRLWGSDNSEHADAVQTWGGVKDLRIDRLTATGDYQGLTIASDQGPVGSAEISQVDMTLLKVPAALRRTTVGGGHLIWLTSGTTGCDAPPVTFSQVYLQRDRRNVPARNMAWPQATATSLPCRAHFRQHRLTWPSLPVYGSVTLGRLPGGSYVPDGAAGSGYRTPGYVTR